MILGIKDGKFQLCGNLIAGFGPANIPFNVQALVAAILAMDPTQQGDPWVDFSTTVTEYINDTGDTEVDDIIVKAMAILKK